MPKVKSGIWQSLSDMRTHEEIDVEAKDNRARATIQVQMDLGKPKEGELVDYYKDKAKSKEWKSDFMNAMRLLISLRDGSTKVLRVLFPSLADAWELFSGIQNKNFEAFKELFPDLYESIRLKIREELEGQHRDKAYQDLLQEMRTMQAKLDGLKSNQALSMPQAGAGIKQLNTKPIAGPSFDDDDDLVLSTSKDENAGFQASQNFIKSMMSLQKA
jgi:hypothetical protein